MTDLHKIPSMFEAEGFQTDLGKEDGIPHLTVWRPDPVMSIEEAARIAAQLQFALDCPVHFHQYTGTAISFFVFDSSRACSASQLENYGTPVGEFLPAVLSLSAAQPIGDAMVYDDETGKASTSQGYGFNWTRRATFCSTARSGKWCVTRMTDGVDAVWDQVRAAVHDGRIPAALVSSVGQAASHGGSFVICVFTPDWTNKAEVVAVRDMLRSFGVTEDIGYKRDIDTERNIYGGAREWVYRA